MVISCACFGQMLPPYASYIAAVGTIYSIFSYHAVSDWDSNLSPSWRWADALRLSHSRGYCTTYSSWIGTPTPPLEAIGMSEIKSSCFTVFKQKNTLQKAFKLYVYLNKSLYHIMFRISIKFCAYSLNYPYYGNLHENTLKVIIPVTCVHCFVHWLYCQHLVSTISSAQFYKYQRVRERDNWLYWKGYCPSKFMNQSVIGELQTLGSREGGRDSLLPLKFMNQSVIGGLIKFDHDWIE